ncbi:ABCB family ABC transporter ATP-binding protein/permease [Pedomonas mirosovicensis]|uniref:ABCB family ABC transporter ATP-binding protein/permease n=1 Tax=Pedomonas mirosovicensis TaxID=2908641 RepID=UPI0021686C75|nr:ABC transporter ATP-binding protein/permease [Pedomonas mirosovicensis]MCH8685981.1 ABC transporter ATP-binding protein/permease [Pedomonas mirosovicensis]
MTGTPPAKSAWSTIRRFAPYLWPKHDRALKIRIIIAAILMVLAKATVLVVPFFFKWATDALTGTGGPAISLAVGLIGGYAGVRFASSVFQFSRDAVYVRVGQRAIRGLALDVFRHLHALSLRFHLERRTGGLSKAIERGTKSIDEMLYFLVFNIGPTIIELIAVCVIFGVNFGWEVVAITAGSIGSYIVFTAVVTEWRAKLRREMVDRDTKANARAIDSLLNFETVKYFNNEEHEFRQYDGALRRYEDAATKSDSSLAFLNIGQGFLTSLCLFGCMALVAARLGNGTATIGDVVLVNTMLLQVFRPLDILGWIYREIKQGLVDMEFMFGLLDQPQEVLDKPGAPDIRISGARIRFDNVIFAYEARRTILHGISFEVPAGHTLAIVGPSGAGKSTISRILFRFYDIASGSVTVDGQDIRDVTQTSLRRAIGIVPQDTVLFNDTIRYNIAYGRPGATAEEVEDAARRAQIHDFILSLPDGYDTIVGERGLKLSGGEKQRVAIARTLLKNPPILILDEATSALDTRTERDIQAALDAAAANRTTLIIAHRLSTVVKADQIIVLEQGRIVERGTHTELLAMNGRYAAMWAAQQQEVLEAAASNTTDGPVTDSLATPQPAQ